jgi:hypothetical protein
MANILHDYIKNYDEFLLALRLQINNTPILLEKKYNDAKILNSNAKLLLKYFTLERKKLIKKIKIHHFILKVDVNDFDFEIDKEELESSLWFFKNDLFEGDELKKENAKYLTKYFNDLDKSIWIAFYNSKIEELKGVSVLESRKKTFSNPIFENIESKQFFEYLIKEWFNTLPKPKSAISFVFYLMSSNDNDLSIALRGLKYVIKDVRQLDFAYYWNENYKEIHKHKYEIIINLKTARLKTFSEIPTDTYINKLIKFVEKFENKK